MRAHIMSSDSSEDRGPARRRRPVEAVFFIAICVLSDSSATIISRSALPTSIPSRISHQPATCPPKPLWPQSHARSPEQRGHESTRTFC